MILTAGLGGMGGAQPLAATMAGAVCLAVEVDPERIRKRVQTAYLDEWHDNLDQALAAVEQARAAKRAVSIGVLGNAADLLPELLRRGFAPDMVTDQTSAHDELNGYVPNHCDLEQAAVLRRDDPETYKKESIRAMAEHVRAMLDFQARGAHVFDYGNNIRAQAQRGGVENAFDFKGFVPLYIRPLFCRGSGPFRWVALSGDPEDIYTTDRELAALFPQNKALQRWLEQARKKVKFQGLPARICWLEYGDRAKAGQLFNQLVRDGKVKAPIVIGRDHLDSGSVASPNRETEGMRDGSDAVSDWPLLNALLNCASGATWVSLHHGGGVGMGFSQHAGMVICCDGTAAADRRIERVLWNDPASGVMRHADAGYEEAIDCARAHGLRLPAILPDEG